MATVQPPFSSPSIRSAGTTTSSKNTSANSSSPLIISRGATVIPGVSMSTKNAVMPRWRESAGPVRVSSTQRSENWARLVQTFWPLITQSSGRARRRRPRATARQRSEARSLPESGSENPWHQSSAPESRRGTTSAASSGGAKSMSVGASTSIKEKRPGSARSRSARAAPSSVRSIGGPPRPPTRSRPAALHPARLEQDRLHSLHLGDVIVERSGWRDSGVPAPS